MSLKWGIQQAMSLKPEGAKGCILLVHDDHHAESREVDAGRDGGVVEGSRAVGFAAAGRAAIYEFLQQALGIVRRFLGKINRAEPGAVDSVDWAMARRGGETPES